MGDKLGYYRALADRGPATARTRRTHRHRRALHPGMAGRPGRRRLRDLRPGEREFTLPAEHAMALTDENSPAFLPGFFQIAAGMVRDADQVIDVARRGDGIGWHQHNTDVLIGCERFFRPGYHANLVSSWLPALDDVVDKLTDRRAGGGRRVRSRASTIVMAQAFPDLDSSDRTITKAPSRPPAPAPTQPGSATGSASRSHLPSGYAGSGYDLVTTFDALHDMGDPVGAARHIRESLAPDGTWMLVEPAAADRLEDNLNPVSRAYYGFSTLLCTPASLSQEVGLALGTQAGPARLHDVATAAGFTRFRVAAQTPLNWSSRYGGRTSLVGSGRRERTIR